VINSIIDDDDVLIDDDDVMAGRQCMPYASWAELSEHGKHICREIVAPKGYVQ